MPELNLVDGLYTYSRPGLNALEREWYHQHVLSQEGLLLKYQQLAEKVAASKGVDISQVYESLMQGKKDPSKALEFFGAHFVEVQLIEQEQAKSTRCSPDLMAEMILRSRLKPDWVSAHLADLTHEYGWILDQSEIKSLIGLPRSQWLSDEIRKRSCQELVGLLPSWQIRALKEFVENELLEGEKPEINLPPKLSEVLGKSEPGSSKLETRSHPSAENLNELTEHALVTG